MWHQIVRWCYCDIYKSILTRIVWLYVNYGQISNWWRCNVYLDVELMGEGMAYGGLPFPAMRCHILGIDDTSFVSNDRYMGRCLCIHPPPLGVFDHGRLYLSNVLHMLQLACVWYEFYIVKLQTISRSAPGSAAHAPCGVWGLGSTTYLLIGGRLRCMYQNGSWWVSLVKWRGCFY